MRKISMNFLNRLELAIFKNSPENYAPVSSTIALVTLVAAALSVVIIFFLQMFNAEKSSGEITIGVIFGLAFIFSGYIFNKSAKALPDTANKVYLAIYALLFFGLCSLLFIWLMVWVMVIAIFIFAVWIVIKATSNNSNGKKRIRVHYNDGSSEDMTESGRGPLGETYYKGEHGGNHMEP